MKAYSVFDAVPVETATAVLEGIRRLCGDGSAIPTSSVTKIEVDGTTSGGTRVTLHTGERSRSVHTVRPSDPMWPLESDPSIGDYIALAERLGIWVTNVDIEWGMNLQQRAAEAVMPDPAVVARDVQRRRVIVPVGVGLIAATGALMAALYAGGIIA